MKLGINSYTYGWGVGDPHNIPAAPLTFKQLIERTKDFSLNLLQLGDNMPMHLMPEEELAEAQVLLKEADIELEVGTKGMFDENIERYLALAERFDARFMRMIIDAENFDPSKDEIIGILKNWLPEFRKKNVKIGIENYDRYPAAYLAEIMAAVDDEYCGICLDTANSFGALEDSDTVIRYLAPYTVNLHMKDISISRFESKQGFRIVGTAAGSGQIKLEKFAKAMKDNGRDVNWILEQWTAYDTDLATTIEREIKEAAEGIAYLKELLVKYQ